jgi:hypothetical protein
MRGAKLCSELIHEYLRPEIPALVQSHPHSSCALLLGIGLGGAASSARDSLSKCFMT